MKIFFDCRFIRLDQQDGISRFSAELFRALSKKCELVAIISDLRQLEFLPANCEHILVNAPTNPIAELFLAIRLNQAGAKLVFSPMQTMGSLGRKYRLVLTLHDLIYYSHPKPPGFLPLPIRLAWRIFHLSFWPQRVLLNRADAVATVSETTRSLINKHNLTKRPVAVIPNAADQAFSAGVRNERSRPFGNKILYMGSFMEYKHVELLIESTAKLPNHQLLLLSGISNERRAELEKLVNPGGGTVEFLGGVTEAEYIEQLDEATALVSASREEGFGIPVVEAMTRGVPVIVSDIPIFHEIAEDAAMYFSNSDEFVSLVNSLADSELWKLRSSRSFQQSGKFSWDLSAQRLMDLFMDFPE